MTHPLVNIVFLLLLALGLGILFGMLEEDGDRILRALFRRD